MREGFAFIEYPYSKEIVKVPGTLEKVLKFYDKYKLSHRRLFYDYCDGREWKEDRIIIVPLPGIERREDRLLIEKMIGNYLLDHNVPILDKFSHNLGE